MSKNREARRVEGLAPARPPRNRDEPWQTGFSLLEVLVAFAITLVVMALTLPLVGTFHRVYDRESEKADVAGRVTRALDDIVQELSRAGYGLGEGISAVVVPGSGGSGQTALRIHVRSNPRGVVATLETSYRSGSSAPVDVGPMALVRPGDALLVVDDLGQSAVVRLRRIEDRVRGHRFHLEPWDSSAASGYRFVAQTGARLMPLRQVGYFVEQQGERRVLMKDSLERPPRALADVEELAFDFFDRDGEELSARSLSVDRAPSRTRVSITFEDGSPLGRTQWVTSVAMNDQSGSISFAVPGVGARLVKTYTPIQSPLTVLSQPRRDWGVIVSAGQNAYQDPSYLYTFLSTERPMEGRVQHVVFLDDIRPPTAACIAPPSSRWPNSLFFISGGIQRGELFRLDPDTDGTYSAASGERSFGGVEGLTEVAGIGLGADSRLYVASRLSQAIYRVEVSERDVENVDRIERISGVVTGLLAGFDGAIYYAVVDGSRSELWRIGFDRDDEPRPAEQIRSLEGQIRGLGRDPLSGRLLMLLREPLGDEVVLRTATTPGLEATPPEELFRLSQFREQTLEGGGEGIAVSLEEAPLVASGMRLPGELLPETLDFVAMDSLGFLFVGSVEKKLVLQFDLDRPDDLRDRVIVAATVDTSGGPGVPDVRLQARRPRTEGN